MSNCNYAGSARVSSTQGSLPDWPFLRLFGTEASKRVRLTLEGWLDDYPKCDRAELEARLGSDEFLEAYFELVLYTLLRRHGAKVSIHSPEASTTPRRPDFLASFPDGRKLIVEAVTAKGVTVDEVKRANECAELYNVINQIESDYLIKIRRIPSQVPTPREVRAFLKRELGKLGERASSIDWESGIWLPPTKEFVDDRAVTEFRFRPRSDAEKGTPMAIGVYPGQSLGGGSAPDIQKAVEGKAAAYGDLNHPYVVAVNTLSNWDQFYGHGPDRHKNATAALIGSPSVGVGGALLRSNSTPKNRGVSAVIIGTVLFDLGLSRLTLYANPWARRPIGTIPWGLDRASLEESDDEQSVGQTVGEVLSLPEGWPRLRLE